MPRPVFGQVDWWTFNELENTTRFDWTDDDYFNTKQGVAADKLAKTFVADAYAEDGYEENGYVCWPDLEFLVSRGTKTVLFVRRRT